MHLIRYTMKGANIPETLPAVLAGELGARGSASGAAAGTSAKTAARTPTLSSSPSSPSSSAGAGAEGDTKKSKSGKSSKKHKKHKKNKKHKIPKGFAPVAEGSRVYFNAANKWFFNQQTKQYYKNDQGPFFVFDATQKKLVPA